MSIRKQHYEILGTPRPKGSKTPVTRNGKTWLIETSKYQKDYEKQATLQILGQKEPWHICHPKSTPISMSIVFCMQKPKKGKYDHPVVKPDLDKLVRTILDACTNAKLFEDDSQITTITTSKKYTQNEPYTQITLTPHPNK